ncbi:uncharacterized protein K452DRAFT_321388 [Aplosporella prunicola CBS 121167]|uniref:NmrA-like domain-containing protein n=1 Tax=Aplosporella prunicola CBS 121167 TaxID=1176127 RepID=A0A6A6B472_9PEZI|nr:uncharacterized protein K452DRAFT_321388 [Aplosporella prunicola CBS 121167]KAF2138014.1 hypothetical protein K452DRAFT_321388 [Aplosporella prunicola CBS 121167]
MSVKNVLITGATGKQGGATITALLTTGADFNIIAVTRNTSSVAAKALSQCSDKIKLLQGDLDEPHAFVDSAKSTYGPIWGVFSVQLVAGHNAPPGTEEAQGKALVDASLAAGVKHFVYTSVERGGSEDPTNIPHFASKCNIEKHLKARAAGSDMAWTILRPVAFLDNFAGEMFSVFPSFWKASLGMDKPLQVIATTDIGRVAAQAFLQPEKYTGKVIPLATSELTLAEAEEVYKKKTGTDMPIAPEEVARGIFAQSDEMRLMFGWFVSHGFNVDIESVKKEFPGTLDFEAWVEKESGF